MQFLNTSICSLFQQNAVGTVSMLFYKHSSVHEDFTTKGIQCPASAGVFSIEEKRTVSLSPSTAELFPLAHFWSPLVNLCLIPCIHASYCSPHCNALLFFPNVVTFPFSFLYFSFLFCICIVHLLSLLFFTSNLIPPVNLCLSADH